MKHTTLLSVYKTILQDVTITHSDFVKIVEHMQQYNGKAETEHKPHQVISQQPELGLKKKRGRPFGSKSKKTIEKERLEKTFSRPNDPYGE